MENLFRPGKWLVLFCGVFVILFATLQYVSNLTLKEVAQINAEQIFTWRWTPLNWQSHFQINDAKVISKNEHDAVVEVSGKQYVSYAAGADTGKAQEESGDCKVRLTFYKRSEHDKEHWELGQVLFED
jgi:hypothetical protein